MVYTDNDDNIITGVVANVTSTHEIIVATPGCDYWDTIFGKYVDCDNTFIAPLPMAITSRENQLAITTIAKDFDEIFASFGQMVYMGQTDKSAEFMRKHIKAIEDHKHHLLELACNTEVLVATNNIDVDKLLEHEKD